MYKPNKKSYNRLNKKPFGKKGKLGPAKPVKN